MLTFNSVTDRLAASWADLCPSPLADLVGHGVGSGAVVGSVVLGHGGAGTVLDVAVVLGERLPGCNVGLSLVVDLRTSALYKDKEKQKKKEGKKN